MIMRFPSLLIPTSKRDFSTFLRKNLTLKRKKPEMIFNHQTLHYARCKQGYADRQFG